MKLLTADGSVWWIGNADEIRSPSPIGVMASVKLLVDTFKFVGVPTQMPTGNDGYVFREGVLEHGSENIVIRELTAYANGVHIVTPGGTENAQTVLEKAIGIFAECGMKIPISPPIHFYTSEIVFDFSKSLDHLVAGYDAISRALSESTGAKGKVQAQGISFNIDPMALFPPQLAKINPTLFRIERRAEIEYEKNRYFSFANLTTSAHVAVLELIEKSIA